MEKLIKIAKEAGEIVKKGYAAPVEADKKSAAELVTKYDKDTEKFLISKIAPLFNGYEIVGEESFKGSRLPSKAVFIDPIDGTANFVHKIPHLAISIGFWEKGSPLMGIIYNPILNELFYAKKGEGAYFNGEKIEVAKESALQNSIIATGFPYVKHKMEKEYWWVVNSFKNMLPKVRDFRRLGAAALDLCYLAQGKFNGFYEIDLKPWDVAAGILIVQEAGGKISNIEGREYSFNDKIIVASNGAIHSAILDNLAEFESE